MLEGLRAVAKGRKVDTCSSETRRKQVCLVMGENSLGQRAGTRGCKRLGPVCLMEVPGCLPFRGCLSFLREKVARLETGQ